MDEIPILWIAAPLTGLIVQPIVGYYSDRTWNRLGRRRPYFLFGALLTTLALFVMPNSPSLWIAAGLLWILDASINVSMEPFRAFVGDQLPPRSARPAMRCRVSSSASARSSRVFCRGCSRGWVSRTRRGRAAIPDTVKYAFYCRRNDAVPRGGLDCVQHARVSA